MATTAESRPRSASGLRFSIRYLLVTMAVIAIGCVALRSASAQWISIMMAGTLLVLAAALLMILFRSGSTRAWWIGFALFGWLYVLLLLAGWSIDTDKFHDSPLAPHSLPTTRLSNACYHSLYDNAFAYYYAQQGGPYGAGSMGGMEGIPGSSGYGESGGMPTMATGSMGPGGPPGPPLAYPGPSEQDFAGVAHALWALLFAVCGGWLASWLYATKPSSADDRR